MNVFKGLQVPVLGMGRMPNVSESVYTLALGYRTFPPVRVGMICPPGSRPHRSALQCVGWLLEL